MERNDNQTLQIEAVEGRLEFGFWAWIWNAVKEIWQHVYFGTCGPAAG